jgi:hypothetical protein
VVEILVALVLLFTVLASARSVFARQGITGQAVADWREITDTWAITRTVLEEDVRAGSPGRDSWVGGGDSISLRVFRGLGVVCRPEAAGSELIVGARGLRVADPAKDSVLALGVDGRWHLAALTNRRPEPDSACAVAPGGRVEEWAIEPPVPASVILRFFERGAYHLSDGALRYRSGRGGRQPLTPLRVDSASRLELSGGGRIEVDLWLLGVGRGSRIHVPWRIWPRGH